MPIGVEEEEHSLEMQYPFIKKLLPECMVVPIMVGQLGSPEAAKEYADVIAPLLAQDDTIVVVSSDFCHWGEDFDYTPSSVKMPISKLIE
jgi:AmmeMemoRadiSam system protein B